MTRKQFDGCVFVAWLALMGTALMIAVADGHRPEAGPVYRSTWCPTPAQRASVPTAEIPARGASTTTIAGAGAMDADRLAVEIEAAMSEINPRVAITSVALTFRDNGDGVLVLAWERVGKEAGR